MSASSQKMADLSNFQPASEYKPVIEQSPAHIPTISEGPVMTGSPEAIASLAMKLVHVMEACSKLEKKGSNEFHKYKFYQAIDVLGALNKACVEHRVACIPRFSKVDEVEKTQRSGQVARIITVSVEIYMVDADTGASLVVRALGTGEDPADKALPKAQTMAIKYALMSMVLISPGDDPEADKKTDEANSAPAKTAPCKHCGKTAYFKKMAEDLDGNPTIEVYICPACKKDTRKNTLEA